MLSADGVLPPLRMEADLPALIAVKDGAVVTISKDLSGLGSIRDGTVEPRAVEEWLARAGVLLRDVPVIFEDYCRIRPEETALLENMMREKAKLDVMQEMVEEKEVVAKEEVTGQEAICNKQVCIYIYLCRKVAYLLFFF